MKEATEIARLRLFLKLISATAAITAYGSEKVFQTSISATDDPSTFILQGELDPWLTTSPTSAKKFHRALSTKLISAITKNGRDLSGITNTPSRFNCSGVLYKAAYRWN